MRCDCSSLATVLYLDRAPQRFEKKLKKIESKDWMNLYECPKCDQLWIIDEWDKYTVQFATKVEERTDWEKNDQTLLKKELLISERGGLADQICVWANCSKQAVNGVAYCIDHLWETGARR